MQKKTTIIFTAVETETRAIRAALRGIDSDLYHLHAVGLRAVHLPATLTENAGLLIMAGLAGALDPALRIGDLLLEDASETVPASVTINRAKIYTSTSVISTTEEKAALFSKTGAAAVEMENIIVRRFAERWHLPFVALRSISDTAAHDLDPAVLGFIDEWGRPKPLALAKQLIRRPGMIPALARLGKNSAIAAKTLGHGVLEIILALDGEGNTER